MGKEYPGITTVWSILDISRKGSSIITSARLERRRERWGIMTRSREAEKQQRRQVMTRVLMSVWASVPYIYLRCQRNTNQPK